MAETSRQARPGPVSSLSVAAATTTDSNMQSGPGSIAPSATLSHGLLAYPIAEEGQLLIGGRPGPMLATGLPVRRRSHRTALPPTDGHRSRRRRPLDEVQHATPLEAWAPAQAEAAAVQDAVTA